MSREASRLGRRPKRPRTDTPATIKNEKEQELQNTITISSSSSPSILPGHVPNYVRLPDMKHEDLKPPPMNNYEKLFKPGTFAEERDKHVGEQSSPTNRLDSVSSTTSAILPSPYRTPSVTVETPNSSSASSSSSFPDCLFQHRQPLSSTLSSEIHREVLRKLSSMFLYQEKLLTDIEAKEMDHIAQVIIGAHLQFCVCTFAKIQMKIEENPPIWADSVVRKRDQQSVSLFHACVSLA